MKHLPSYMIEVSIVFGRQLRSVGHSILCLLSAFFRRFLGIVTIFNLIIVQKSTVALKHQFECILVVLSWNDTGYRHVCSFASHKFTTTRQPTTMQQVGNKKLLSNLQQALKQINTHSHACTQLNNSQRCQALTIQQQCSNQYLHLHLHLHQTTTSTMKSQLESNHTNTTQCRPNNLHPPLHILPHSCTKEISFTSSHQPFNGTQEIIGFVRICCLFYKDHDFYWGYGHGCCQCQSALFA